MENEAGPGEVVRGLIIASSKDERLGYALKAAKDIRFMTYRINFELNEENT